MARKRNGSFPESVQPGLPVLESLPNGWQREPLGKRVKEIQRPVKMRDDVEYDLVTVKRSRGGAVKRETLCGREIKVKSQFEVHSGDFLISKRQIVHGACAIVPDGLDGAIVSNEYSVLNTKKNLDPVFLRYLSETTYFQQTCFHSSIGVHVEKMVFKLERWLKWMFNFPPFAEQQKIADVLSTLDETIVYTQDLLENTRQQKKALMQRLLTGKNRLPGFSVDWQEKALGELFKQRIEKGRSELPLVSITRIEGVVSRGEVDKKDTSSEDKSKYLRICPGDIGYNTMRMWQGVSGLSALEGIVSPAYTILIPRKKVYANFFAYLFKFEPVIHSFFRHSQGLVSDTWNLKYSVLAKIKVLIPTFEEQIAIAKVLSACDAVIAQYEAKLANLQSQKKAIMQQLLTGKRRVKLDEPADTSAA